MTLAPSDPASDQAEFPARMTALAAAAAFTRGFCERHAIGRDDALRLTLVVEELFSNTVRHGYGRDSDEPVRIALAVRDDRVAVLYEDGAPPFDPLARMAAPPESLGHPVETRAVGGLGVHLLGQLIDEARYAYEQGRNRLWLTLACAS